MSFGGNGLGYTRQIDLNMQNPNGRGSPVEGDGSGAMTPPTDPLGPFTPEAAQAIAQAKEARQRSSVLRREIKEAIDNTQKLQQAAHEAVNGGMNRKVAETVTLKVRKLNYKKSTTFTGNKTTVIGTKQPSQETN